MSAPTQQELDAVRGIVRRSDNPSPMYVVGLVLATLALVWLINVILFQPSLDGVYVVQPPPGTVNITVEQKKQISHNPVTDKLTVNNVGSTSLELGYHANGHVHLNSGKSGVWDSINGIIMWVDGSKWVKQEVLY